MSRGIGSFASIGKGSPTYQGPVNQRRPVLPIQNPSPFQSSAQTAFGRGFGALQATRVPVPYQPPLTLSGYSPGARVTTSPAGLGLPNASGYQAPMPYYSAATNPLAYRSRSIEIQETGEGSAQHASGACGSSFYGFAQRLTALLSPNPPDDYEIREALNIIENCMEAREQNSGRYPNVQSYPSGFNARHEPPYNLVENLGEFIADYYNNAITRGAMTIKYLGSVNQGFQATLSNPEFIRGRTYTTFQIRPSGTNPTGGGKRKATRKQSKSRKQRKGTRIQRK